MAPSNIWNKLIPSCNSIHRSSAGAGPCSRSTSLILNRPELSPKGHAEKRIMCPASVPGVWTILSLNDLFPIYERSSRCSGDDDGRCRRICGSPSRARPSQQFFHTGSWLQNLAAGQELVTVNPRLVHVRSDHPT